MSSVIERLRATHHLALRAQHVSDLDAAALVRAWPHLALSAHDAYVRLPRAKGVDDRIAERIALDSSSLGEAAGHSVWPGGAAPDGALMQVTAGFRAAASALAIDRLLSRDSTEAKRLIISSLWTTARLVGQATRDHGYNLYFDDGLPADQRALVGQLTSDAHRRFNAIEQLAVSSLRGEPQRDQRNPASQLRQAVATWDIEAHRALLNDRSTTVLHVLAHQEAASARVFETFINRAAAAGVLDPITQQRLQPVLADSAGSWTSLRDTAAEFSFSSTVVPMSFIDAATNLRERFQDALRLSGPDDHSAVLGVVSSHLASAVTISATARDLISEGELRAPARAIARVISEQRPQIIESLVSVQDIRRGVSVPLPDAARQLLAGPATRAFHDADESLNRAGGLDAIQPLDRRAVDTETPRRGRPAAPPQMNQNTTPASGRAI